MTLDRPIAFIDVETTGVDPVKDRIIEFGAAVMLPTCARVKWKQRFNPGISIPAEATAVHGISDADVANEPPFGKHARGIWTSLQGKDLAGYNLRRFDLPIIDEELRRCGLSLDLDGVQIIDCFGIFSKMEPRKLEDAVRRYCGREHTEAHGAGVDASATLDVFLGQMAAYPELDARGIEGVASFSSMSDVDYADIAGKLYRKDGNLCFGFGKHQGAPVSAHLDYADWVLSKDFPSSTKEVLQEEMDRLEAREYEYVRTEDQ